jgi:hypothetical protein
MKRNNWPLAILLFTFCSLFCIAFGAKYYPDEDGAINGILEETSSTSESEEEENNELYRWELEIKNKIF